MKFEFKPRKKDSRNIDNEWKTILLRRKLLAAAESSSSAATGRSRNKTRSEK